jgi:hypothetical protein
MDHYGKRVRPLSFSRAFLNSYGSFRHFEQVKAGAAPAMAHRPYGCYASVLMNRKVRAARCMPIPAACPVPLVREFFGGRKHEH